jgi:predicted XRE-type DNA-binding protein
MSTEIEPQAAPAAVEQWVIRRSPDHLYLGGGVGNCDEELPCDCEPVWGALNNRTNCWPTKQMAREEFRHHVGPLTRSFAAVRLPTGTVTVTIDEARSLDTSLRSEAHTVARSMIELKSLIEAARERQIHSLLGFTSWTAYIADVVSKEMDVLPRDDRQQIVALMSGEGMSQRAIADALGVSQSTVRDDVSRNYSPGLPGEVITGLDGKSYPAQKPKKRQPKSDVPAPKSEPVPSDDDAWDTGWRIEAVELYRAVGERFRQALGDGADGSVVLNLVEARSILSYLQPNVPSWVHFVDLDPVLDES